MILVIGASGRVGGVALSHLRARGVPVRAFVRETSAALLPDIEVVRGDLTVASSLEPALDGVDTVLLIWKQITAEHPEAAIEVISRHARRVVYISSLSVRDDLEVQAHPMSAVHAGIERAIADSVPSWTVLRSGWFMANVRMWADELRATGAVRLAYPLARRSPVDRRDVGEVAAAVLTGDGFDGRTLIVSGPERLTDVDLIAAIGRAAGRPYRVEEIDVETARLEMIRDGLSPELTDAALAYWRRLVDVPEAVTSTVADVTGHPARTFAAWAAEHAADFV
ncbi:MAG TPA: NAD(P)H-binding protein [Actinomycetota bacterium]